MRSRGPSVTSRILGPNGLGIRSTRPAHRRSATPAAASRPALSRTAARLVWGPEDRTVPLQRQRLHARERFSLADHPPQHRRQRLESLPVTCRVGSI
jgi:hypothetical protein